MQQLRQSGGLAIASPTTTSRLNVAFNAAVLGIIAIMRTTESGRTQVRTSLTATVVLVGLWPLVRTRALADSDWGTASATLDR